MDASDCTAVGEGSPGGLNSVQPAYATESDGTWGPEVEIVGSPLGGGRALERELHRGRRLHRRGL